MKDLTMLKTIMKQRNFNTVLVNISKTTSPTSDSFLLIMLHITGQFTFIKHFNNQRKMSDSTQHKTVEVCTYW